MKRKLNKRSVALLVSLAVILTAAVGVTLAYIFTNTDALQNIFTPAQVSCAVVENGEDYTDNYVDVKSKGNVSIRNTGNTNAYIRVAIIVTWKAEDGTVYAQTPVIASADSLNDYSMTLNLADGWSKGTDGYYYYAPAVSPDGLTNVLITSAIQNATGPKDAEDRQYYLSIEIVASAIQADGMGASSAQEAWAMAKKTQGSN